jgi:outer membrane protein
MKNPMHHFCKSVGLIFFSGMFLLAGGTAMADDIDASVSEPVSLERSVLGLGVAFVPDYEGSDDYTAAPLLQARFNWSNNMYFSLLGNTARANLIPSKQWHFGPLLRYRAERNDVENDRVDAMEEVDAAVEVGVFSTNCRTGLFDLLNPDVADAHDGYVDLDWLRHKLQDRTTLTLFAKTTYASEDYMDTYFGIDGADAARSGLRTFNADSEWKDVGVGVLVNHTFDSKWGLMGAVKYTKLLGDASDSPIVDDEGDDNQWLLGVLVNYRF